MQIVDLSPDFDVFHPDLLELRFSLRRGMVVGLEYGVLEALRGAGVLLIDD